MTPAATIAPRRAKGRRSNCNRALRREYRSTPPSTAMPLWCTPLIAEHIGKQRRGAIHRTSFAIRKWLGFGIHQLATDHFSQNQRVVAGRVLADEPALEPGQCLTQQGKPFAAHHQL